MTCVCAVMLGGCASYIASVSTQIGTVTGSMGFPSVVRNNRSYILAKESKIYPNDILDTNEDSKIQIRMVDDTLLTIGNSSHVVMHHYEQKHDWADMEVTITKGAIRATRSSLENSGEIVLNTPLAMITSRSLDFWAGFIFSDRTLDVAMISGSMIEVSNRDGSAELTQPSHGIKVTAGSGPQEPILWNEERINAAIDATSLGASDKGG